MSATDPNLLAEPLGSFMRLGMVLARREGRSLSLTSGRRSVEEQIVLRRAHCGTSQYDIYDKPASLCNPPTARPGTSKHQTGEAADMSGSKDWLYRLLSSYGIARPVPGEDWHFEYRGSAPEADLARALSDLGDDLTDTEATEVAGSGVYVTPATITPGVGGRPTLGVTSNPLGGLTAVAGSLADPAWWRRVGLGAAGVGLLAVALYLLWPTLAARTLEALPDGS